MSSIRRRRHTSTPLTQSVLRIVKLHIHTTNTCSSSIYHLIMYEIDMLVFTIVKKIQIARAPTTDPNTHTFIRIYSLLIITQNSNSNCDTLGLPIFYQILILRAIQYVYSILQQYTYKIRLPTTHNHGTMISRPVFLRRGFANQSQSDDIYTQSQIYI